MPLRRLAPSAWPGCLGIVADMAGLGMMAPLLPFHVEAHWVGPILTGQYMAVIVGQIIFGMLSDRLGRQPAMLTVMFVDMALFVASGFISHAPTLLIVRVLAGLAGPVAISLSWISDVSESPKARHLSSVARC